eukprot:jgi/Ulvmu1/9995/UM059_0044.1
MTAKQPDNVFAQAGRLHAEVQPAPVSDPCLWCGSVLQEFTNVAAARIKEAQLRAKPERREWEAAPSFFKWTCGNYPPVREARALDDFNQKLSTAQSFRQAGNALLAESKLEDALMQYSHGIAIFLWFQRRDERYVDQVKLLDSLGQLKLQEMKQAQLHLSYSFLNAASALMQQGQYEDAVYSCTKALEFDADSAKGHFRRAQANYALDSTHHLELAVKDLKLAAELSPSDPQIRACLNRWKQELTLQNTKDRKTFKNIFCGGSLYKDDLNSNSLDGPVHDGEGWLRPPFSQEAKKHAAELGIDLDNKEIQAHLLNVHARHQSNGQHIMPGTGVEGRQKRGSMAAQQPQTYLQFWGHLLTGKLHWKWQHAIYIVLVGNSVWQASKMLLAYHRYSLHEGLAPLDAEF